ncbi:tetratricopeptide repeat protein [Streptosporangium sp. NPDC023615]|uniref:tetratricopeptide repeat protein n=1 Tax=Streptosporangium sp. NPDC023615 TaxID=3154794 RepID=UPI00343606BE
MKRLQAIWIVLLLLILAVVAATPAIRVLPGVTLPTGLSVTLVLVAALAVALGAVVMERYKQVVARRHELDGRIAAGCLVGRVRKFDDPVRLGVHRSIEVRDKVTGPPKYIPRDVDEELRGRLRRGGFVLIVGDSTAGKSRTAYEAMRSVLGDHTLVAPDELTALPAAIEEAVRRDNSVLWLSDLERYLGSGGLTRERIFRVVGGSGHHRVILATMRSAEQARIATRYADQWARQLSHEAWEVFDQADQITLARRFSRAELARAHDHEDDTRIASALANADRYGIAEYLAAGPVLKQSYVNAWDVHVCPRGAALVAAAIDCRRAGYHGPVPRALVQELHESYLRVRGESLLRPGTLEDAWEWATEVRESTTALLSPTPDGTAVLVFDYLVDSEQLGGRSNDPVPDPVIDAIERFADPDQLESVAETIERQGRYRLAERLRRRLLLTRDAELGMEHSSTLMARVGLARLLCALGRPAEAETELAGSLEVLRRVHGDTHKFTIAARAEWGHFLFTQARLEEAEAVLRSVIEARTNLHGHESQEVLKSRNDFAGVLWEHRRLDEAETEYKEVLETSRRALGDEHPCTLLSGRSLGSVYWSQGRLTDAERTNRQLLEVHERVLGSEHPDTLTLRNNQATVLWHMGRMREAETELRAVLDARSRVQLEQHPYVQRSRNNLAKVLRDLGRCEESLVEFGTLVRIRESTLGPGHRDTLESRQCYASMLAASGDLREAVVQQRTVVDLGEARPSRADARSLAARTLLSVLLHEAGHHEEGEEVRRSLVRVWEEVNAEAGRGDRGVLGTPWYLGHLEGARAELNILRDLWNGKDLDFPAYDFSVRGNRVKILRDLHHHAQALRELRWLLTWKTETVGRRHPVTLGGVRLMKRLEAEITR